MFELENIFIYLKITYKSEYSFVFIKNAELTSQKEFFSHITLC